MKLTDWIEAAGPMAGPEPSIRRRAASFLKQLVGDEDPVIYANTEWADGKLTVTLGAALSAGLGIVSLVGTLTDNNSFLVSTRVDATILPWDGALEGLSAHADKSQVEGVSLSYRGGKLTADAYQAPELLAFFRECAKRAG